ncbi:MAG: FAD-dependent oxidoreductase [Spirochaetales bacterium]|nr:FAD-dependent oxidoreductase [Spirochaetales bacterium]
MKILIPEVSQWRIQLKRVKEYSTMNNNGQGTVLVAGGGIGGIQASLDLANAGFKVILVEKSPSIGGIMAQLDKTFPTNDCSMCIMSPKLVDCARHLNINLITCSEIEQISGNPGHFTVKVNRKSRYIDETKCTGCGECVKECPVEIPNEFDDGLSMRKAIFRPFPQAAPNAFVIDKRGEPPCRNACPAGCNVQGYIALIQKRKFKEALELIRETIPIPAICGRICGHLCEQGCNRKYIDDPLQIRLLKRFVTDYEMSHKEKPVKIKPTAKSKKRGKVAIIGSGPAGITAAYDLCKMGYQPIVFEALGKPGGMLRVGIPKYRLPDDIIDYEIDIIRQMGVEIRTNTPVGADLTIKDLFNKGFEAVFIAIGTHKSRRMEIEGEDLPGVHPGMVFLRNVSQGKPTGYVKGKTVVVIGGGNTAIDAVRTASRLGAKEAFIVYRRSRDEMPVSPEELNDAEAEGIKIHFLLSPVKICETNGKVSQIICNQMILGAVDSSGRRRPVPVEGKTVTFDVDIVIPAIGQEADYSQLKEADELLLTKKGFLAVDPVTLETNLPGIFAGGDVAGAGALAIHSVGHGHEAAISIDRYIKGEDMRKGRKKVILEPTPLPSRDVVKKYRIASPKIAVKQRMTNFNEVETGFSEEQAVEEAERCLSCGTCSECLQCVTVCKADAINHNSKDEELTFQVGSVIVSPGCDRTDLTGMYQLGFGKYPDVVTALQFERILSASGPYGGHIKRPSDGKTPAKIAFIQCAGSRDTTLKTEHCSSVCCMYAMKEAVIAKEHEQGLEATLFYMDIRAQGKGFDAYYERAKNEYKVRFKRSRVSEVTRDENSGQLTIHYESENGETSKEDFDMVILSQGFQGKGRLDDFSRKTGLPLNSFGFIATDPFMQIETRYPGIFILGPAQEPKDIPETVIQASAAASAAAEVLAPFRFSEVSEKSYPEERDTSAEPVRIGVFVCNCGINIGGIVDVPNVSDYAKSLEGVVHAESNLYTCSQDTQDHIKEMIKTHGLNRVVVASCSPRTHEPLFQETIREAGLNRNLFIMANIRDQCSWIHRDFPEMATEKSKDLIRMAVAKVRLMEALPVIPLKVTQKALVIGGGAAGMSAALSLANQDLSVDLVEKEKTLGGNLNKLTHVLQEGSTDQLLKSLSDQVMNHPKINVHLGSGIKSVDGFIGNYKTTIAVNGNGGGSEIDHGVTIIATGANESVPTEYSYGKDKRIKTGLEFENFLNQSPAGELPDKVVFIQCVGSRDEEHMYCSRVCCTETIKNALTLKAKKPSAEIYVLCRDMRTYGFSEIYYKKARDAGVIFARYDLDSKPVLATGKNGLNIKIRDTSMNQSLAIPADMVVLAARIDPAPGNEILSQHFKVPLNQDGFFLEAHVKLRPVDFATEGVFLAGMAHTPKNIQESLANGRAAAARAATIISRDTYMAEATIAAVNEDICDGCGVCVGVCEYKALEIRELPDGKRTVELKEAVCKGCGCCVAACPSGAMEQKGFKNEQVFAEIDAALM